MAKKKSSGEALLVGAGIVIAILAAIPKEAWIGLGAIIVIFFVGRIFLRKSEPSLPPTPVGAPVEPSAPRSTGLSSSAKREDRFVTVVVGNGDRDYEIPKPIHETDGKARWISPGESVEVAGLTLPGGMLYIGSGLQGSYGQVEPSLINSRLKVAPGNVDLSLRLTNYWPSYADCTPDARRAYLQWLVGGRSAPDANIGYVFLFFYGLERRVLVDAISDETARSDIPAIVKEVHRLLVIYSENGSFRRYASQFLGYIEAEFVEPAIYKQQPPVPDGSYELPMRLRIGLGQLAVDQQPVPASWALAWALSDPNIVRRTAVSRCREMFAALFKTKWAEMYGDGFLLSVNRTKLKLIYQPASAALRGRELTRNLVLPHPYNRPAAVP